MAKRIEIALKRGVRDARGRGVVERAKGFLQLPLTHCETRDFFKVHARMNQRQISDFRKALTDPVIAVSSFERHRQPARFDWVVEIGLRHGVTDNVGHTARVVAQDLVGRLLDDAEEIYAGTQYFVRGPDLTRDQVWTLARQQLANELIQTIAVYNPVEWQALPPDNKMPLPAEVPPVEVKIYDLSGTDESLMRISRDGILSLSLTEMHTIRDYFAGPAVQNKRKAAGLPASPTDVEVECLAQTWSEHCKHKIFSARVHYTDDEGTEEIIDGLFPTFIKGSTKAIGERIDWLVSVFSDNAGVIRYSDRHHLVFKVETHNSPSALDPYGGAITGIVGCNRDPMGTGIGAELLYNTWGYCLGSPFYKGDLPEGLFHPRRIRDGVHQGVIDGGNQSGIPWARGWERMDDRFIGKPLVFCGTVGRLPVSVNGTPSESKMIRPGDFVVMAGGRIGKDGIHGATFSSEELRTESPTQAVQIGDPITQRILYEFLVEARDAGLYRTLTDNGAGGLSSSVGEMATLCGGVDLDLAKAPVKYGGLQPWEIFLSEAQERMSLAVPPEHLENFLALAARRGVEATALGTFQSDPVLILRYGERVVGRLDMEFLHEGCPRMEIPARWTVPQVPPPPRPKAGMRNRSLTRLLADPNLCSREFKSRQYDAEVKGLSVIKPFVGVSCDIPSDATVLLADHGDCQGVVVAEGINPFLSDLDTYAMMASVIDEGVRRIVSVGGRVDRIAGLDNFCWPDPVEAPGNPDGAYKMAQLVRANQALYDITTAYGVPCISGKDSMKNDSIRGGVRISIPPTVLFSTLGMIDDINRCVTLGWKRPGDLIYVLGVTHDELGASAYHRVLALDAGEPGSIGGSPPHLDAALALGVYRGHNQATAEGSFQSSHTPTQGGLAVGLALCCLAGGLGAEVHLGDLPVGEALKDDALLFSESNSRFVVTCQPENEAKLQRQLAGLPFACIGSVADTDSLRIHGARGKLVIDSKLRRLRRAFQETLHGQ